ncbi:hypothetical protein QNI16_31210 [Cytophagaceae bacterium YF14B1]|uniref:CAAX prenyl protease 2/Lysostaphin resistance protein A-like domain-containing protein n=1 Tax=Xanthocytophaga flava TaxID=3048013 RepID=A0AAE3QTA2_9BACT|nr:CPBP family glutamic-type intramembrane protease [Xanthocytophaga flavus]MDJ1485010.1 hypothetical protein [Xanthocytophaga flavus]
MNGYKLVYILLVNILIIILFNWLFYGQLSHHLLQQLEVIISANLVIYAIQISCTYYLLQTERYIVTEPLQRKPILFAFGAMILVHILTAISIFSFSSPSLLSDPLWRMELFLVRFFLYILPAAFIEEFLFRYFPYRYSQSLEPLVPFPLFFCITILFALVDIPASIFHYNLATETILKYVCIDFGIGLSLLMIYMLTKNLFFTALCNALNQEPFFPFDSPYNYQSFYASIFLVSVVWALLNLRNKRKSVAIS